MRRTLFVMIMTLLCVTSNAQRKYVETIYGYLKVFPEELGTFESIPSTIISNLNARNIYSYNSWRVPTNEELQLIKSKGYLTTGVTYMTKENPKGVCQLVTDKEVSLTKDGHEYVDLGLPSGLKWATCNIGAKTPEDYGEYFAWGETNPKAEYTKENSVTYGEQMGDISGNAQYDAATANWGGGWRMPSKAEMQELVDHCEWEWTQLNGVNGARVIGPNGSCIFLPAAGYRHGGSALSYAGHRGYYWSSTPDDDYYDFCAYYLDFRGGDGHVYRIGRNAGQTVRPITE